MSETEPCALIRVRFTYARRQPLRYVSHLDMQQVWERSLRRAGMPLAYSKGFHPSPRLHQAAALPLGFLSRCEITDVWLEVDGSAPAPDPQELKAQLEGAVPPGLELLSAALVPLSEPALQTQVQSAAYAAEPLDPITRDDLQMRVQALLAHDSLPRERRGKPYDLRPLIEELAVKDGSPPRIEMRLVALAGATGRPEEVLSAMGLDWSLFRIERLELVLGGAPDAG